MIDAKLVDMLRCPIDGSRLRLADPPLVDRINQQIAQGEARDRLDQKIELPVDGGLINQDASHFYPIRQGIPTLVADQAIEL